MELLIRSPYRNAILSQILHGKHMWSNTDVDGDHDVFFTQVVTPLRELKYAGVFDALSEVESPIDGEVYITGIEIIGAINYHREREDN
jgi:hypothetical protein